MSFDIFVHCCRAGANATFSRQHFDRIFGPHVVGRDDPRRVIDEYSDDPRCLVLQCSSDHGGDVYIDEGDEIDGFMINRPGTIEVFNNLFQLVRDAGAVVFWPGNTPYIAVADATILAELPPEILPDVIIVSSGAELLATASR
jgi:hypothetical protein